MSYCRDNFLELVYLWSPDQLFKIRLQVGHHLPLFYYIMISVYHLLSITAPPEHAAF